MKVTYFLRIFLLQDVCVFIVMLKTLLQTQPENIPLNRRTIFTSILINLIKKCKKHGVSKKTVDLNIKINGSQNADKNKLIRLMRLIGHL